MLHNICNQACLHSNDEATFRDFKEIKEKKKKYARFIKIYGVSRSRYKKKKATFFQSQICKTKELQENIRCARISCNYHRIMQFMRIILDS